MGSVDVLLGPVLISTMISILLLGIMVMQTYIYFERHRRDQTWVRATVIVLFLLDVSGSTFIMSMIYNYLVTNFGNMKAAAAINAGLVSYPIFTGVTACIVQCFFARRINLLTHSRLLTGVIVFLSLTQMSASIAVAIEGAISKEFAGFGGFKHVVLIWLLASVITDTIITVSLVRFLYHAKTGYPSTDHMTARIIRFTIQTGLLTTSCALAVVVSYLVSNPSTISLAIGLPLSKLYTNSLMSSLNARKGWDPEVISKSNRSYSESIRNVDFPTLMTVTSDNHGTTSPEHGPRLSTGYLDFQRPES